MPYVEITGEQYFYLDRGPGGAAGTVLFLHGSGGSCSHWAHQLALAGPGVRVLAVDLPGHGHSAGCPFDRVAGYREFVQRFTARLSLPPLFMGGHSMGGAIALDFALHYPDRLAGLILIGAGARLKVSPAIMGAFGAGQVYPELVEMLYGPRTPQPFKDKARLEMEAVDPGTFYADFSACNAFDIMNDLTRINTRTLVLVGTRDRLTPPKFARYLGDHLPHAGVVTVEEAGHMLMLEEPQAVNESVAAFLAAAD
ncbi:MAG TPA: alpha/beta hydrolase [Spirochaetia bacterium]|nr:alpha/beta hydrolase [Spirochaetia bacterium]